MKHPLLFSVLVSLSSHCLTAQNVCTVTAAGQGCAPLTVTLVPQGNGGNHDLTLLATDLHPRAPGAMVWGMHTVDAFLPAGACPLLTDYVWGHTFQSDTTGSYKFSRSWPNWFQGYFYMQMGTIDVSRDGSFEVRSTDCKLASCSQPQQ